MTSCDRDVVAALGTAITQRIGEPRYNLWFARNTKYTWTDNELIIGVPNHFFQEWLENTFGGEVRSAASDVFGAARQVRFAIDPQLFQAARQQQAAVESSRGESAPSQATRSQRGAFEHQEHGEANGSESSSTTAVLDDQRVAAPARRRPSSRQRRWHRLSDFVIGPCNRLAQASAVSVIEAPAQCANPLILHGPVGTGKTHLLESIYAGLRKRNPEWRVCFTSAEEFTNRFVQAMRLGKLGAFRKHYRECDAFLIDDLNFLATKKATQEEFLHTFDVLHAEGQQLVATCDCHPKLTGDFTPELTDRLLGGAVWGLVPPDAETRLDILRAKSARHEPRLSDEVLRLLAGKLRGNVRELEGALHTVRHFSRVTGRNVDLALAREALGDVLRHSVRVLQLPDVDSAVCRALRLEEGALQARRRSWVVSHPRMLAMFLARKHTAAAYSEIGRHFGGRNHSTVVAAEKKVRNWLEEDASLSLGEQRLRVREVLELVERELVR